MVTDHTALTDASLRVRYTGAWDACDRGAAHALCVEMRRRGMLVPAWPGIHQMTGDLAEVTPPGVMLLAVLRVAGERAPIDAVRRAVCLTYPEGMRDRRKMESDIIHARASGLMTEDHARQTWTLATGPRVDAIVGTMPADGPHMTCARLVWEVVS